MVKKFKNVLEGGLIGLQVDGILESVGWAAKTEAGNQDSYSQVKK